MTDVDYANMSDEEFIEESNKEEPIVEQTIEEEIVDDNIEEPVESEDETEIESEEDTQEDDTSVEDDDDAEDDEDEDGEQVDEDTDTHDGEEETDATPAVDFELGYNEIMAPFKANGKEMKVSNVDDARRLMQMGAGYTKRMSELKPHLKIIKSLKDNGLLDDAKINELIDLSNKNPEAITKLIKESGIDPLDIDTKGESEYKPTDYSVSDSDFNLDTAIDNIRSSDTFDKAMDVMGKQWDQASKNIIYENPEIVGTINDHIQSGLYDKVQEFVETERTLGRLDGMSDVEAYRLGVHVLDGKTVDATDKSEVKEPTKNPLDREVKKKQDEKRKQKKKSAAPVKSTPKKVKADSSDELASMSDDEFTKKFGG